MRERRTYPPNGFRVCIDSRESDICGVAFSPLAEHEISYRGFNHLMLEMDQLFDQNGYPQAFQEKRSFLNRKGITSHYKGVPKVLPESEQIYEKQGKILTVDVVVRARRNASWQGSVYRMDGSEYGSFEGEIELLEMLLEYA